MSVLLRLCIAVVLLAPTLAYSAVLGIPSSGFTYSGVGVVSGWKCETNGPLTAHIYDEDMMLAWPTPIPLVYGTERTDVLDAGACDSADVGFVAIWNWGNLGGDGTYTAVAYDSGEEFARSTFEVATFGTDFLKNVSGECRVPDFPMPGESTLLAWNEATQHFEVVPECPSGFAPADQFAPVGQEAWDCLVIGKRIGADDGIDAGYLEFPSAGRFIFYLLGSQGSETYSLTYSYSNTGPNTGTFKVTGLGGTCTVQLTFTSATTGTARGCEETLLKGEARWWIEEPDGG